MRPPALLAVAAVATAAVLAVSAPPAAALPGAVAAVNTCGPSRADALTETPWPLRRLQPSRAWPLSRGAGVTVAVIDSGVSDQHPRLAGRVLPGVDYTQGGDATCDNVGHGTFVAAIVAGRDRPDATYTGIAPDARILPMRVLKSEDSNDPNEPAIIAHAIRDAVAAGAQVINLSLVVRDPTADLANAVSFALASNVVVVAAAGNDGGTTADNQALYPAAYPGVIAVAGTDQQDQHVSSSSRGGYVDVAAPGLAIVGPLPRGGGYGEWPQGGTSFSAAYVSGVAALLKGYDRRLTPAQVADRIERTADHPPEGRNDLVGYGVVNPYQAVASVSHPVRAGTAPGPAGGLLPPPARADPFGDLKVVAVAIAAGGLLLAVLVLIAAPIVRRGRRRGWRPSRARPVTATAAARRRDEFVPVTGRTMSVTTPVNRRAQAGAGMPPGFPAQPGAGRSQAGVAAAGRPVRR